MFLMRLPLQTRYTILSEGCSCPTMPNDDEIFFIPRGSYVQLYHCSKLVANLCLSLGITCFLSGTSTKAQHVTNRLIRAVIIQHVAFGAIPRGVPITALPSCFSFSCRWHILSVVESACFVSTFQLVTLVATCFAQFPLFLKPCVRYAGRFSCFG